MIYYEAIKSPAEQCNGCILSAIDENEYEITIKKEVQLNKIEYQQIKIINKETQQLVYRNSQSGPLPIYCLKVIKARCHWKNSKTFCFFLASEVIKILSEKEVLLKIL